jgi:FKBP-type peptidyl-prolyl cis-trans isomerase
MNMKRTNSVLSLAAIVLMSFLSSCLETDQGPTVQQRLNRDIEKIDAYLDLNEITAIKHASGLRFVIQEMGTGLPALSGSNVKVKYEGYLMDTGALFEENEEGIVGTPASFIDGWEIALTRLPQGTRATLYIPSVWAYGTGGSGTIPPNANLIFNIEIVSVAYNAQQQSQLNSDRVKILNYLDDHPEIDAVDDASGMWYDVTQEGEGTVPALFSRVKLKVVGKLLDTGTIVISEQIAEPTEFFDSYVADYPNGMKAALLQLGAGTKVNLYVPSTLAYGPSGSSVVPGNSNMIFELEILEAGI